MGQATEIEWADATWNPVRGCSRISEGCRNCYAERFAARLSGSGFPFHGFASNTDGGPRWTGRVRLHAPGLFWPMNAAPQRVFVNSMSDLFHESLAKESILAVLGVIAANPRVTFQVLTKRPERALEVLADTDAGECARVARRFAKKLDEPFPEVAPRWPLPNLWLGISVENADALDHRIGPLLKAPAALRWISAEPLIGRASFAPFYGPEGVEWVVAGGESGPGARPAHPDWFRELRDECVESQTPFFFKQWGAWCPSPVSEPKGSRDVDDLVAGKVRVRPWQPVADDVGRLLDGRTWSEIPAR